MDGNHLWLLIELAKSEGALRQATANSTIANSVSQTLSALVEAFAEELDKKGAGQQ